MSESQTNYGTKGKAHSNTGKIMIHTYKQTYN